MAETETRRHTVTTGIQDGSALADELLQRIGQMVGDRAKVSTVFGDPVEREGVTVIPVAKARFGFGAAAAPERVGAMRGQAVVAAGRGREPGRLHRGARRHRQLQADLQPARPGRSGCGGVACNAYPQATAYLTNPAASNTVRGARLPSRTPLRHGRRRDPVFPCGLPRLLRRPARRRDDYGQRHPRGRSRR